MLYVCVYLPVACLLLPLTALKQTSKDKQNALVRTMKNITQNYIIDSTLADRAQQKKFKSEGKFWRKVACVPECSSLSFLFLFYFYLFTCLLIYSFIYYCLFCFVLGVFFSSICHVIDNDNYRSKASSNEMDG